jgi:tetrahydromethanopterin S-methyltransferase subunit A
MTRLVLIMEIEGDDPDEVTNAAESLLTHADNAANNYPVTVAVSEGEEKEGEVTMSDTEKWIIVVGTIGNLEKIVGPFDTEDAAREFAIGYSGEDRYDDWLSMPLTAPADEEDEAEGDAA